MMFLASMAATGISGAGIPTAVRANADAVTSTVTVGESPYGIGRKLSGPQTYVTNNGANTMPALGLDLLPPGRPGAPSAVDGDASATVTVSPPTSGGAPDSYTVTASPDGPSCTVNGVSGSCVVTGLTNGLTYSFTATATNSAGTSAPSAPSNPVTLRLTPIDIYYFSLGGPATLGDPTGPEVDNGRFGGAYRNYGRGTIYWSPTTFSHLNKGAIRSAYSAQGWENGPLGYPTSDETGPLRNGGVYQSFQGGTIHWSPATGAHITKGAIAAAWAAQNWENGTLGYPTSDEIGPLSNGGVYQSFQGGTIYWSPATGAHVNAGAIRTAYAAQNWENGSLGYPTTNEYPMCGGAAQDFQAGRITWTPTGGTAITRG